MFICIFFDFCDRITALPTGVLQIYGVEQKDAGNYRCVATTIANRRKSTEAVLSVIPGTHDGRFFSVALDSFLHYSKNTYMH